MLSSYIEVQGARPSNFFKPQTLTSGSFAAPLATRMNSISFESPKIILNSRTPIQEHSSTFKVCYFLSKYPYSHNAYLNSRHL